jgi:DNA sulfur modification protein DndB
MESLFLPALTGQFSNWRYFEIVMPVREIIRTLNTHSLEKPDYRIKTVAEVEEVYSRSGISNMLQRVFDSRRLEPIKNYLTKQSDRYVNNLTVAIFGGPAEWLPIGITPSSLLGIDEQKGEEYWEKFAKSFGIIKLTGKEILFVLDGQHRIMSMREAVQLDPSLLEQEVAITLISHKNSTEGRRTTRRLFTTVNRYG